MKNFLLASLLTYLLFGCTGNNNSIHILTGKATNYDSTELYLTLEDLTDTIPILEDGTFYKELILSHPTDGRLHGKNLSLNMYLEPGKSLEINFDGSAPDSTVEFAGDLMIPAIYLHEKSREVAKNNSSRWSYNRPPHVAADYRRYRDSIRLEQFAFLESFNNLHPDMSRRFNEREKKALEFNYYQEVYSYPRMLNDKYRDQMKVPANWYAFLDDINIDDSSLLEIGDARWFIIYFVALESAKQGNISFDDFFANGDWVREEFAYVKDHFTHQEFYNELCHHYLTYYMEEHQQGTAGIEDLIAEYMEKSTNEGKRRDIQRLIDQWAPITSGQPAPDFTLPDDQDNWVSLTDFKGQYVFIDFWFTTCGPCLANFPALEQIIDEFQDRNLIFLSISVDKVKSDWEKMLREGYVAEDSRVLFKKRNNWIQLIEPNVREVAKKYMVTGYPTYVLIDPEGNFVNARCEMPKRIEKLRRLLNAQQMKSKTF